jgi:hypothetical protein
LPAYYVLVGAEDCARNGKMNLTDNRTLKATTRLPKQALCGGQVRIVACLE